MIKKNEKQKTYAFVDASNIIYGARAEGWFIDQKKLLNYLRKKIHVSKAFFYGNGNHINGIENFWSFTKRRLAKFNEVKVSFNYRLNDCEW